MADYVWSYWTGTACATQTAPTNAAWANWNSTSVATGTGDAWTGWVTTGYVIPTAGQPYPRHTMVVDLPAETEEQRQERLRRSAAAEVERLAAEVRYREREQAASAKAEALLLECLTAEQAETYRARGHFFLRSQRGRRFRIARGWSHNVEEIDNGGRAVRSYCLHPIEMVPYEDNMLAQKLLLESDERRFMRTANQIELAGPRR